MSGTRVNPEVPEAAGIHPRPPYVSFQRMMRLLESAGGAARLPQASFPDGTEAELLSALKTLGLVDGAGSPTTEMARLAKRPHEAPNVFRAVLERIYPGPMSLVERQGPPEELDEYFSQTAWEGSTQRRARTFFLKAAGFVGLDVALYQRRGRRSARGLQSLDLSSNMALTGSREDLSRLMSAYGLKLVSGTIDKDLIPHIEALLDRMERLEGKTVELS